MPSDDLLTILPRLYTSCSNIVSFSYSGPTNDTLILLLFQLRSLKRIRLSSTSRLDTFILRCLHQLPLVEELDIELPLLHAKAAESTTPTTPGNGLSTLRTLTVFTTPYGHGRTVCSLAPGPHLRELCLRFLTSPLIQLFKLCGLLYLQPNPNLEKLSFEFSGQHVHLSPDPGVLDTAPELLRGQNWFPVLMNNLKSIQQSPVHGCPTRSGDGDMPYRQQGNAVLERGDLRDF